jgi:hypothetical protein
MDKFEHQFVYNSRAPRSLAENKLECALEMRYMVQLQSRC